MGMQTQLVLGGVVVLIVALSAKTMMGRSAFQRVPVAFTVLWASLVAWHFWGLGITLVQMVPGGMGSEELQVLGGFWLAFVLGVVPGFFMIHSWMRNWEPSLPRWFGTVAGNLAPVLVGVLLGAHVLMCAELAVPKVQAMVAKQETPGRLLGKASRFSLRTYSRLAARICGMSPADVRQDRVPLFVLQKLRQDGHRPKSSPPSSS